MSPVRLFLVLTTCSVALAADQLETEVPGAAAIRKKYDELKYRSDGDKPEMQQEIPFCWAVAARRDSESLELLQEGLKDKPALLEIFSQMQFSHTSWLKAGARETAATTLPGEQAKNVRAAFSTNAQMYFLSPGTDTGKYIDRKGTLNEISQGDYVLSTTAPFLSDSRYHTHCWDRVTQVLDYHRPKNINFGAILYRDNLGNRKQLRSSLEANLRIYVREGNEYQAVSCQDLPVGAQLVSPDGVGSSSATCVFADIYPETVSPDEQTGLRNLEVELTGAYFIGELGAQILVHH